jgi:hypothetical protein
MKTLGQLQVGDTFYLINYDEGHISDVCEKVVSVITDIAVGKIVKYLDAEGVLHRIDVTKDEFENTDATAYYLTSICSDKERCLELLEEDKKSFLDNYSRIITKLND